MSCFNSIKNYTCILKKSACIAGWLAVSFINSCSAEVINANTVAELPARQITNHNTGVSPTISLSVKNASLQEDVAALARMSGRNIVTDTKSKDPVTLHVENVSLSTALDILTAAQGLSYTDMDGVILVTKEETLKKQAAGFYTFSLNYVRADDIQKSLSAILNSGKLAADSGSNTLLFNGSPAEVRKIKEALQVMDVATRQVTLEAKILSIEKSEKKNLGLQWSWDPLPQYITNRTNNNSESDAGNTGSGSSQGAISDWGTIPRPVSVIQPH